MDTHIEVNPWSFPASASLLLGLLAKATTPRLACGVTCVCAVQGQHTCELR